MPRFTHPAHHCLLLAAFLLLLIGHTPAKASLDDCANSGISSAKRRALLVGISVYNPVAQKAFGGLPYPANDVARMKELLESQRYGFKVCTLRDSEATRNNILQALEQYLFKELNKGDVCLFYYSGHGSWVKNSLTDENDKRDETIVPYDVVRPVRIRAEFNDIRDKELAEIFNRAIDSKAIVTAILDDCHSGSGLRKFAASKEIEGTGDFDLNLAPTEAQLRKPEENGALVISAAQDFQLASGDSYSIGPLQGTYSHLTAALLLAFYSTSADLMSAQDLFSRVNARLKADGRSQNPIFAGIPERMRQTIFGGATSATGHTRVGVTRDPDTGRLLLLGGLADGLTDKCELTRIDPATGADSVPAVNIGIVRAGLNKSTFEIMPTGRNRRALPTINSDDIFEQRTWSALSEPNIKVWIPAATLSETELNRVSTEIAKLRRSNQIEFVEDPSTVTPTHIVAFVRDGRSPAWVLRYPTGLTEPIKPGLTAEFVLALLEQRNVRDAKLFVDVPPSDLLRRQIQLAARNRSAVAFVDNNKGTHYELVGRARVEGERVTLEYAWMLPAALEGVGVDESAANSTSQKQLELPTATCWTGRKTTTCPQDLNDLESLAYRLSKIRGWLKLTSPLTAGGDNFPYRLELRRVGTNQRTTGMLVSGEFYNLFLVSDDPHPKNIFAPEFYVYVLDVDASGRSTVQYPTRLGSSGLISCTHEFATGTLPAEIQLTKTKNEQIGIFDETDERRGVLGTEHFILIVTDEPLPNLNALSFDGVQAREKVDQWKHGRSLNPLAELLLEIGHDSQSRVVSTLDNWIVDHQTFRSVPSLPR